MARNQRVPMTFLRNCWNSRLARGLHPRHRSSTAQFFWRGKIVLAQTASMHLRRQPCAALGC